MEEVSDATILPMPAHALVGGDVVVEAEEIERLGETCLERLVRVVHPGDDRPRRILPAADGGEPGGHRLAVLGAPLLGDLVADAPHHDARVIAVAADHVGQIALAPLVEELAIAEARLVLAPLVERLVHHDDAHAVAHLEQLRRGRIVAGADGVARPSP